MISSQGCELVLDFATRRIVHSAGDPGIALAPGSTLKPFVIAALLERGKLRDDERRPCPVELRIKGRSFACSHPVMASPMTPTTAIAYSCNSFVARYAERFESGELGRSLWRAGFAPSRVEAVRSGEESELQALGSSGIAVTPNDLLMAYRQLAIRPARAILEGLEGAVEYGTAQRAKLEHVRVAGKTGTAPGNAAWFAGFAPSRSPQVVAVVLTAGKSGGADAAPIAARLIAERVR